MYPSQQRFELYGWVATSYHEAGHAVAIMLLGRKLLSIEVSSHSSGAVLTG